MGAYAPFVGIETTCISLIVLPALSGHGDLYIFLAHNYISTFLNLAIPSINFHFPPNKIYVNTKNMLEVI